MVVVPVVLAGCAGAGIYGKPDVTYQEWKRDDDECRRAAGAAGRGTDAEAYTRCMRDRGYRIQ